jgi:sphingolipid delta-4 desaturase
MPPATEGRTPQYKLTDEARAVQLPAIKDFVWSETDEPHATRRRLILAKHPEIRTLFTKEPRTFVVVLSVVILQVFMAQWAVSAVWWQFLLAVYVVGGTVNHTMQMAGHELSHNLCWDADWANKLTAILANLPTGLPSAILFQKYHMEHHQFQGCDGWDLDVPTVVEGRFFRGPILKALWVLLQPVFYSFRPMLIKPKQPGKWEVVNFGIVALWDAFIVYHFGFRALAYLLTGTLIGFGLHPVSGHLLAEHFLTKPGKQEETYSYYGVCNYFNLNVGYHNEHHDFPRIPWSNLPKVKKIAAEFYEPLPHHTSYLSVIWTFITDSRVTTFSRVKRPAPSKIYKSPLDKAKFDGDIDPMTWVKYDSK